MVLSRAGQALLWSALIFPGAGHVYLKYFWRGSAFIAAALLSLSVLLFQFEQHAMQVLESTLAGDALPDVPRIAEQLLHASAADPVLRYAQWALALCWLVGVLDAYRLGKKTPGK